MTITCPRDQTRNTPHPYLRGNFAPVKTTLRLTPCTYIGSLPDELSGGEYVRNGGNPVINDDLGRDAHWFDGDGMLSGVAFQRTEDGIQPGFVNQFVLTDVFLSSVTSSELRIPILPSIAALVNPVSTLCNITLCILRTLVLVILSHLPGSTQAIKRISVANTGVMFHDGRALATCESGPPMRIALPSLETVGWFDGKRTEGEKNAERGAGFGGEGVLCFMREWTTAHPRVDPVSGELIAFHSTFAPPYVYYSIVPPTRLPIAPSTPLEQGMRLLNAPVLGMTGAKMMHDFSVSHTHTVIMDLPLSLDPMNLAKNKPVVAYDAARRSRFGVFPRYRPEAVRWFETDPCCIFHTANSWDEVSLCRAPVKTETIAVNMLSCRLTSASLVFAAGNIAIPEPSESSIREVEQCRLYYHRFSLADTARNQISDEFAISAIPFEFPSLRDDKSMAFAKYIYGCSMFDGNFNAALGRSVKIDCLVKIDVHTLIARGRSDRSLARVTGCIDNRTVSGILASPQRNDPISIFKLPPNHYAQESRFVARRNGTSEDDGYLLFYVFDETQLDIHGECPPEAKSELWIIDAKDMSTVIARVLLPQRVPYGLHGNWFSEEQILSQREVESVRAFPRFARASKEQRLEWSYAKECWMSLRQWVERSIG